MINDIKNRIVYVFNLFGEYKKRFLFLIFLMFFGSILESVSIVLILPVLESILNSDSSSFIISLLHPLLNLFPNNLWTLVIVIFFVFVVFIQVIFKTFQNYYEVKLINNLRLSWRLRLFNRYLISEYAYILNHKQGELLHNITTESGRAGKLLLNLTKFAYNIFLFLLIYLLLLFTNVAITSVLTIGILILFFLVKFLGEKYVINYGKELIKVSQDMESNSAEAILSISQVKIFSMEKYLYKKYKSLGNKQIDLIVKSFILSSLPSNIVPLIIALGMFFILIYITFFTDKSIQTFLPTLGFFFIATQRLSTSLIGIFSSRLTLYNLIPSLKLIQRILNTNVKAENYVDGIKFNNLKNNIIFKDVYFSHSGGKEVFKNLNITFIHGKMTAIVGESGIGKSSLVGLLERLYDPDKGSILINGKDLRDYNLLSWRKKIGFVTQDALIFNMSVKDNILVGDPNAIKKDIIQAAKTAHCFKFIESLPNGWDTIVGDRGTKLSGGQRQRIAIARAVIRKPELYIFDEATSSLDRRSEKLIQKSIEELSKKTTIIIIAHRLSTIENADKIYDLNKIKGVVYNEDNSL